MFVDHDADEADGREEEDEDHPAVDLKGFTKVHQSQHGHQYENHHNGGLSSFLLVLNVGIYLNSRNKFIRTSFRGYRLLFRRI